MWRVSYAQLFKSHAILEHVEQSHATTQQIGRNVDIDLVNQPYRERLFARQGATELDVPGARSRLRLADRALDAVGNNGDRRRTPGHRGPLGTVSSGGGLCVRMNTGASFTGCRPFQPCVMSYVRRPKMKAPDSSNM